MKKIFILHGWTYSTDKWQPFVNLLKQKGLGVNILKIPGLTEKLDNVWRIDDYVDWLRQKLDNQQFSNKTILLGHSNGGRIALNFAIKYPESLENLILIDSAGIYHNELLLVFKKLIFKNLAKVGKKLTSSPGLKNILYKIIGESDYKNADPIMKQTMLNLINSDKSLSLPKVDVPTLIIWGEKDKTTPLADGKRLNRLIKNSKLHVVDGARHSPQFSHADEVIDIILKHLKTKSRDES